MSFTEQIKQFNAMYSLPHSNVPSLDYVGSPAARLTSFLEVYREELDEYHDLVKSVQDKTVEDVAVFTEMCDWFGDLIVYAVSEALRYGIVVPEPMYSGTCPEWVSNRASAPRVLKMFLKAQQAMLTQYQHTITNYLDEGRYSLALAEMGKMCFALAEHSAATADLQYRLPVLESLDIIMQSNFSKLGANGEVLTDGRKVLKGPNYWKPEPKIREMLLAKLAAKGATNVA